MSRVKQKLKKFVMWGIKEGARSLTNLRDTLSKPIASDFIEKPPRDLLRRHAVERKRSKIVKWDRKRDASSTGVVCSHDDYPVSIF
jgi:hypothetical protein